MVGIFRMCVDRELGWLPPEALGVRQDQGNINHENNFAALLFYHASFTCGNSGILSPAATLASDGK